MLYPLSYGGGSRIDSVGGAAQGAGFKANGGHGLGPTPTIRSLFEAVTEPVLSCRDPRRPPIG